MKAAMPTPYELLRVADLIKLAADTATACTEMEPSSETERIEKIALRIKAAAEDLKDVGRDLEDRSQRRVN